MAPSLWQIIIVIAIVLFIFGPKRIPGLGKSLGEAIRGFRKGLKEEDDDKKEDSNDHSDPRKHVVSPSNDDHNKSS